MTGIVQAQRCETDCTRLCNDFAFFVDTFAYIELSQLFTLDATFERRGEVLKGREAILLSMQQRPKNVITRHVCTNIRIEPQPNDTALGSCYLLLFHSATEKEDGTSVHGHSLTIAEYKDIYVYTDEGWRVQSRVANVVF